MSILIGSVDPQKEIVELWFELIKTQAILEIVLKKANTSKDTFPILTKEEIQGCEMRALQAVQVRFPHLGVTKK